MTTRSLLLALALAATLPARGEDDLDLMSFVSAAKIDQAFGRQDGDTIVWLAGASAEGKMNYIPFEFGSPIDFGAYRALRITATVEASGDAKVAISFSTPSTDPQFEGWASSGYSAVVPFDWSGEATRDIPLSDFSPCNSPVGLSEVMAFSISNGGWTARVDDPEAKITFTKIELIK